MSDERSLSEVIHDLKKQNEKIKFLLGEMVNEYFREYDSNTNAFEIVYDFNRNRIKCEIAWDYFIKNTDDLKILEDVHINKE